MASAVIKRMVCAAYVRMYGGVAGSHQWHRGMAAYVGINEIINIFISAAILPAQHQQRQRRTST